MAADTGKRVLTSDVKSVIESDFARQVHPVREYIQQLPMWDGNDRVVELSAHVHAQATTVLTSDDEAQQLFQWAIHKWLVGMVATWMSDREGNQEILTLIGADMAELKGLATSLYVKERRPYASIGSRRLVWPRFVRRVTSRRS